MAASETDFYVWGIDQTAYGPVELPTLVSWVRDERVTSDTWLFVGKAQQWQQASQVPELHMFFKSKAAAAGPTASVAGAAGIPVRALRRIKILADMTDEQLERFAGFLEGQQVPQWTVIVRQGDPGDSMFLILEGELRVRLMDADKETILATLGAGEFFGDISLFDHGPRSADVVANVDSLVVKVAPSVLDRLSKEAPDLAALFLRAMGKTLTARIRADNKRYGDSVKFARAAH
jgi:hypothetical protein